MTSFAKGLCWPVAMILLTVGNAAGLIADSDAATMLAVIPALWVATTYGGNCWRKRAT